MTGIVHATSVDTGNYPDDGTSPVGTTEWNQVHTINGNVTIPTTDVDSAFSFVDATNGCRLLQLRAGDVSTTGTVASPAVNFSDDSYISINNSVAHGECLIRVENNNGHHTRLGLATKDGDPLSIRFELDGPQLDYPSINITSLSPSTGTNFAAYMYMIADRVSGGVQAGDFLGGLYGVGDDSIGTQTEWADIIFECVDPTNGSEDGRVVLSAQAAGSRREHLECNSGTLVVTAWGDPATPVTFNMGANAAATMRLTGTNAGALGPNVEVYHNSSTPAASDIPAQWSFYGNDSAVAKQQLGDFNWSYDDPTAGSADAHIFIRTASSGSIGTRCRIGEGLIVGSGASFPGKGALSAEASVSAGTYLKSAAVTVTNLPSASGVGAGARHFVTDATTTLFMTAVIGSGTCAVPVVSNGSSWYIG